MEVDVTGLMQKPIKGWEERATKLCDPKYTCCSVDLSISLWAELTEAERTRLIPKLKLVEEFARYMTLGMLKGTIKYERDNYSLVEWMAHLIGEGADQANYQMLLFDSWRRDKCK